MECKYHWIGLSENSQETPIFNDKNHGFRLRFSLKPIQRKYVRTVGGFEPADTIRQINFG
jgi:hypothetical protein